MNGAELFLGALRGETMDRTPVFFTGGGWVGRFSGLPRDTLLYDPGALAGAHWKAQEAIGHDAVLAYFDALHVPEAYGCELRFLETGPLVNPLPFPEAAARTPELSSGRLPVVLETVSRLSELAGGRVAVGTLFEGPFTTLARIVDAEVLLRLTLRDPGALDDVLLRMSDFLLRFGRAAAEAGAQFLFVPDPVASSTMISPRMYRRFVLPFQQRIFQQLQIPVMLHICGDTSPVLLPMAESGAAALSLDQCMDLAAARAAVGWRCALAGNVDPMALFMAKPEEVERQTRIIAETGGRRGFVLMPGCAVPPEAPLENVAAMVRAALEP